MFGSKITYFFEVETHSKLISQYDIGQILFLVNDLYDNNLLLRVNNIKSQYGQGKTIVEQIKNLKLSY